MQRIRFIAITALALLAPSAAFAQEANAPVAAPALTPPKLVKATQPVYPAAKLESGVNASVALVLTLDETGKVTDVAVANSAGDDFDQAAWVLPTATIFRLGPNGFEHYNHAGELTLGLDPVELHFVGQFRLPSTMADAFDSHVAAAGDLALGRDRASALSERLFSAGLLQRFDPARLEKRLESQLLDKVMPQNRKARMWDLMAEQHAGLVREAQDEFDRLFGRAFRAAYEEQLRKLRAASKGQR